MNKLVVILFIIVFNHPLNAQDSFNDNVYDFVEIMPEFPGGGDSLIRYFSINLDYNKCIVTIEDKGRIDIKLIISENGTVSSTSINNETNIECIKEINRVLTNMPKWTPGYQNGKPVKVRYTIPLNIHLK